MTNIPSRAQFEALLRMDERPFDTRESAYSCTIYFLTEILPQVREQEEMGAHFTDKGVALIVAKAEAYFRHAIRKDRANLKKSLQR
jgi:hypothetical protein